MGLAACLAGTLAAGTAFAVWTFTATAATTNSPTISVGAAVNVTGCMVYNKGSANTTTATATLHLLSPTSSDWTIATGVTRWTVEIAGDLSGASSTKVHWKAVPPANWMTYCVFTGAGTVGTDGSVEGDISGYTNSAKTRDFSLPTVAYQTTFVNASSVVGGYSVYSAMKAALGTSNITFTFTAIATPNSAA